MSSLGDQFLAVLIDSIGLFLGAVINAVIGAFLTPLLEAIAMALGFAG